MFIYLTFIPSFTMSTVSTLLKYNKTRIQGASRLTNLFQNFI